MPKILHLNASPRGPHSSSQRLAEAFLAQVGAGAEVETVKLFDAAMPAFAQAGAEGKLKVMAGMAPEDAEQAVLDAAQPLIDQLKGADKVVVSTGMWNFSVPYPLKHYIDLVVQPGRTFSLDATGTYVGLVTGKPLAILVATGSVYEGGPMQAFDMCAPYLRNVFGFMGFQDIRTVVCPMTAFPPPASTHAMEGALAQVRAAAEGF